MAAFERVLSGIPEMDKALDNIRLGDNVVFRGWEEHNLLQICQPRAACGRLS